MYTKQNTHRILWYLHLLYPTKCKRLRSAACHTTKKNGFLRHVIYDGYLKNRFRKWCVISDEYIYIYVCFKRLICKVKTHE